MIRLARISGCAALALAAFASVNVASADGHFAGAVKARIAHMQLNGFFMSQLAAIAKGDADYDPARASGIAKNLLALSTMDGSTMWPPGSGNDNQALKGKTRAKPEIWSTYPKVAEKAAALTVALETMVEAAGKDLPSLQAALGEVGAGCGGCHRPFRAEKF